MPGANRGTLRAPAVTDTETDTETEAPADPPAKPSAASPPPVDREAWSGRFGWIIGGALGLVAGFFVTWAVEMHALKGRVVDPTATATRLSSVLVPACFIAGALAGHALGLRGGPGRYRLLGGAAGVTLAALAWAALVISR